MPAQAPTIGERIRACRERRHKSREQLAVDIGRSFDSVRQYERGDVVPPVDLLRRIAASLGVELIELIEGNDAEVAS